MGNLLNHRCWVHANITFFSGRLPLSTELMMTNNIRPDGEPVSTGGSVAGKAIYSIYLISQHSTMFKKRRD
jgi:hypothetical protein